MAGVAPTAPDEGGAAAAAEERGGRGGGGGILDAGAVVVVAVAVGAEGVAPMAPNEGGATAAAVRGVVAPAPGTRRAAAEMRKAAGEEETTVTGAGM